MCNRGHSESAVEVFNGKLVTEREVEWVGSLHHLEAGLGHSGDGSGRGAAAAVTAAHQRIGEEDDRSMFVSRDEQRIRRFDVYQLWESNGDSNRRGEAGGRCVGVG